MKFIKPPKLELYSFLFSIPLISVAINQILFEERLWTDPRIWWFSFPLICVIGVISWYGHVLYSHAVEQRFPLLSQSRPRILRKMLVLFLVMTPSLAIIFLVYDFFHILGYELKLSHLPKGMLVGFTVNIIFESLYEAEFIFSKYRESIAERETMMRLSVAQEFDSLKSQVNPHFLFNCFNTLSSLITVDKERSEQFLNEMSKVYRYLLRNNEEGLSTVENEIRFIRSYFQLLQTRHGEAVHLNVHIEKRYESYLLPSLSLQLLIENVVKHNALSKNKPLTIDILTVAGNKLVVSNNLQRRVIKAPSNGVGLENIREKYQLLRQQGFQIIEDEKHFTVVLPLIWQGGIQKEEKTA